YYTPEAAYYPDEIKIKGNTGVYCMPLRGGYISLAFNTDLISPTEAPQTYNDLLDPRWKGKMSIGGTSTGMKWLGNTLEAMGQEYLEKLSRQEIRVHNISGPALATLIVAGEVPLSPTIHFSNAYTLKQKGASIEWKSLEPVLTIIGRGGITVWASHPHAALLFLDYIHSKEGQQLVINEGLITLRKDMKSPELAIKENYLEAKYSTEEYQKKYSEWENLMRRLFIMKR
ncbi:ABC transporter substrate-binding protein, partial [Thermodesulfobacteriota bacterium]